MVDGSGERERSSLMTPVVQLVNAQHVWMRWWRKMCARQKRSMKGKQLLLRIASILTKLVDRFDSFASLSIIREEADAQGFEEEDEDKNEE